MKRGQVCAQIHTAFVLQEAQKGFQRESDKMDQGTSTSITSMYTVDQRKCSEHTRLIAHSPFPRQPDDTNIGAGTPPLGLLMVIHERVQGRTKGTPLLLASRVVAGDIVQSQECRQLSQPHGIRPAEK